MTYRIENQRGETLHTGLADIPARHLARAIARDDAEPVILINEQTGEAEAIDPPTESTK